VVARPKLPLSAVLPSSSVVVQFREASQGAEIRMRGEDASYTSWADHPTADIKGDLPVNYGSSDIGEKSCSDNRHLGHCRRDADASGSIATIDDGSTPPGCVMDSRRMDPIKRST